MKGKPIFLIAALGVLLVCQADAARKAYVTDILRVTLRAGPGTKYKIITMLSSGQSVEVLEEQGNWSHIRVTADEANGREGWVVTRFLITRTPYELQATSLLEENQGLKEKLKTTQKNLNDSVAREKDLTSKLQTSTKALDGLRKEFEALKEGASGYLKLRTAHKVAKSKLESIEKEAQELNKENEGLKSSQRNKWFATGALVLLCGLMIGLVFGRQQGKRRSAYY
jgi:SH3 domain protein